MQTTCKKSTIFWHVTTYSLVVYRSFGGMYCLHLQGPRVSQATNNQPEIFILMRGKITGGWRKLHNLCSCLESAFILFFILLDPMVH
jgi:hypothetical protein